MVASRLVGGGPLYLPDKSLIRSSIVRYGDHSHTAARASTRGQGLAPYDQGYGYQSGKPCYPSWIRSHFDKNIEKYP